MVRRDRIHDVLVALNEYVVRAHPSDSDTPFLSKQQTTTLIRDNGNRLPKELSQDEGMVVLAFRVFGFIKGAKVECKDRRWIVYSPYDFPLEFAREDPLPLYHQYLSLDRLLNRLWHREPGNLTLTSETRALQFTNVAVLGDLTDPSDPHYRQRTNNDLFHLIFYDNAEEREYDKGELEKILDSEGRGEWASQHAYQKRTCINSDTRKRPHPGDYWHGAPGFTGMTEENIVAVIRDCGGECELTGKKMYIPTSAGKRPNQERWRTISIDKIGDNECFVDGNARCIIRCLCIDQGLKQKEVVNELRHRFRRAKRAMAAEKTTKSNNAL